MNKIASVETISHVAPHTNADRLELATILGFQCVTEKGLYKGGETIIYVQPDNVLPDEAWTAEYRKYSPKRIKAVKLRGEWSEGIIIPHALIADKLPQLPEIGTDVSEILGVIHYEPPTPQDLQAQGFLPYKIGKTDEDRIEGMRDVPYGVICDISLKIDGQSCSFFYHIGDAKFGVLGRTMELKTYCQNKYTDHIERYDIQNKLTAYCIEHNVSLCIRGESYGIGIQAGSHNPHAKMPNAWAMFSVYNIDEKRYCNKGDANYYLTLAEKLGLLTVPTVASDVALTSELVSFYSKEAKELMGKPFEGVVLKHANGSFKIISKHYDSLK